MRFPVLLGTGAMTAGMLLLGGLVATELNPVPVVNVDAMELDGASVLAAPMPQVSPRPHLMIRVSRPLNPGDWHLALDGRTVDVAIRSSGAVLRVALPGPLQLSSHHTLELVAGAIRVRAALQVVPPRRDVVAVGVLQRIGLQPPIQPRGGWAAARHLRNDRIHRYRLTHRQLLPSWSQETPYRTNKFVWHMILL